MSTPEWTEETRKRLERCLVGGTWVGNLGRAALAHIDLLTAELAQWNEGTNDCCRLRHEAIAAREAAEAKLEHFEKDIHAADVAALKEAEAELAAARDHHAKYHGYCSACSDRAETVEETHKRWAEESKPSGATSIIGAVAAAKRRSTPEEPKA